MSMTKNQRTCLAVALGALILGGGIFVGTRLAQADGVPQTNPLTYAGTLLDAAGNPATGTVALDLNLHTTPTGGSAVCSTSGSFNLTNTKGRFQMVLDAACTTAVHATPDLFVDLKVNGTSIFATRPKLGAVPYALEADTSRVARRGLYENPTTMNESSAGGGFCGLTPVSYTGGTIGGYAGGKQKCQATMACNSSTAHMCSSEEMVRYAQTGGTHTAALAWIATGVGSNTTGTPTDDCKAFTDSTANEYGVGWVWSAGIPSGNPHAQGCTLSQPIACCD